MISAISTALSGLAAASKRLDVSATNIANLDTTGSIEAGGKPPYAAQTVQQTTVINGDASSVIATAVPKDPAIVNAYDPDSPFANAQGIIGVPNVNLAEETVNIKLAEFAYKANLNTIKVASEMQEDLLKTFDRDA